MTRLLIVAAAAILSGCMSLTSVASIPATSAASSRCTPEEAAALPEGARIQLSSEWTVDGFASDQSHRTNRVGTILKASPEGVALVNCMVEQRSSVESPILRKLPHLSRLYRNTGVGRSTIPVVWVPVEEMGHVQVLEDPPADYISPGLRIDTTRDDFFERIGVDFDFNVSGSSPPGEPLELVEASPGQPSTRPVIEVRTARRSVVERVTDDPGCFSGNSPRRTVELVDPRSGEVIQRKVIVYDAQGTHIVDESLGNDGQIGVEVDFATGQVYVDQVDSTTGRTFRRSTGGSVQENPGVQSLGRRTSGHGPATPDPGTARID